MERSNLQRVAVIFVSIAAALIGYFIYFYSDENRLFDTRTIAIIAFFAGLAALVIGTLKGKR